jgi:hypothetical protein
MILMIHSFRGPRTNHVRVSIYMVDIRVYGLACRTGRLRDLSDRAALLGTLAIVGVVDSLRG